MRIYTRTGDDGGTSLWRQEGSPRRVAKDDLRVEAYGAVDEANSAIGLAKALLGPGLDGERALLEAIQHDLFAVGSELATPDLTAAGFRLGPDDVSRLERAIDQADAALARLRSFILPDGTPGAAALHVARTAVRRAERRVVSLERSLPEGKGTNSEGRRYLNRLSDLLFVLARAVNAREGRPETAVIVRPPAGPPS